MPRSLGKRRIVILAVVLVVGLAAALVLLNLDRGYDRAFDTGVADPAYPAGGPVVLFDEGHLNTHTTRAGYRPFAELLRSDGYEVRVTERPLAPGELDGVGVLVLALARGSNATNDDPAYDEGEAAAVEAWVRARGSLLLVTDHWPYGTAVASLARRFGVGMGEGMVQDPAHHDPERGDSYLVFSEENGLLRDHPIVRGRSEAERVHRVLTFTGQSVHGPPGAVPVLALSDEATERPPGPASVEREGGDVRVSMEYGEPASAAGRAQGLALEVGAGRVVVLGEAGMLRAQRERSASLIGMNVPGYDNRQLALSIVRWLSHAL